MQTLQELSCPHAEKMHQALDTITLQQLLQQLGSDWQLTPDHTHLYKKFHFQNAYQMITFVNAIAWMTHFRNHPPELELRQDHCLVCYTSTKIKGLSEYDFLCAHKVEHLFQKHEEKIA